MKTLGRVAAASVSVVVVLVFVPSTQLLVHLHLHLHVVLVLTISIFTTRLVMQKLLFSHQINLGDLVYFVQAGSD